MTAGSGSTPVAGFSDPGPAAGGATIDKPRDEPLVEPLREPRDEPLDEHCRRAPAEPLRPETSKPGPGRARKP
jgi:hypothetical protein